MKSRILVSLLLVTAVLLGACQPAAAPAPTAAPAGGQQPAQPAASSDPIKVAILAPLSGSVPTFGISTRDGALMAIDEWNAKGGVLGKKIEAVVADSQCEADPAVNAANKVIDQDKVQVHRRRSLLQGVDSPVGNRQREGCTANKPDIHEPAGDPQG